VEIVASANKDSEILRGEGDAQRSAIFAQAYQPDPEFFQFYRSLESYRNALSGSGTTMVLNPDSEFFQYFKADTANGTVPKPAAPNGIQPLPDTTLTVPQPSDTLPPANVGAPDATPAVPPVTLEQATPPLASSSAEPSAGPPPGASSALVTPSVPGASSAMPAVNPDGTIVAPSIESSVPASSSAP
ncbi:MAG: hypothetical protein ACTHNL_07975, partial [Devosia sp.]